MSKRSWALLLIPLFASPAWSKGPVVRIEIRDAIHTPLVVTDTAIVNRFDIWNGPSVRSYANGVENPPAHLDSNADDGRFVDWPAGVARQRAQGLPRFEVSFHVQTPRNGIREYLVAYEIDIATNQGYVYLPRWENNLIWHGIEGDWFFASDRWDALVMPLVVQHASNPAVSAAAEFRCGGTARIAESGTIDIRFIRDGAKSGRFRFTPATEGYAQVREHVGAIEPGEEKEISCWPPRA